MRRRKQLLSGEETRSILENSSAGVLGVVGDDGYPYTVPMSYVYKEGKIYMHSAREGHKIDSIRKNEKVGFTVIGKNQVIQETFTTYYLSVSIFGRARILIDPVKKKKALEALVEKYSPDYIQEGQLEIEREWEKVKLIEIEIEHMTGKSAIELIYE